MKLKVFFMIFKEIPAARNCFRSKNGPLIKLRD